MSKAHELGQTIARSGCVLITGACPGSPLAAACGAKHAGGLVVGISPALHLQEHVEKYRSPVAFHDVLIFTGSGMMGREVTNIRSSDMVVIVGGRSGTLGELAIAYDEGKPIGVLSGTGGISDMVAAIIAACRKDTGAQVIYESDPQRLIEELLRLYRATPYGGTQLPAAAPTHGEGIAQTSLKLDPVCGMHILPQAAVAQRTWRGAHFVFCSMTCVEHFDAGPAAFMAEVGAAKKARRKSRQSKTRKERKSRRRPATS